VTLAPLGKMAVKTERGRRERERERGAITFDSQHAGHISAMANPSGWTSHASIISKQLHISNFFHHLVGHQYIVSHSVSSKVTWIDQVPMTSHY